MKHLYGTICCGRGRSMQFSRPERGEGTLFVGSPTAAFAQRDYCSAFPHFPTLLPTSIVILFVLLSLFSSTLFPSFHFFLSPIYPTFPQKICCCCCSFSSFSALSHSSLRWKQWLRYGHDNWGPKTRFPSGQKVFFFPLKHPDRLWSSSRLRCNGYRGFIRLVSELNLVLISEV